MVKDRHSEKTAKGYIKRLGNPCSEIELPVLPEVANPFERLNRKIALAGFKAGRSVRAFQALENALSGCKSNMAIYDEYSGLNTFILDSRPTSFRRSKDPIINDASAFRARIKSEQQVNAKTRELRERISELEELNGSLRAHNTDLNNATLLAHDAADTARIEVSNLKAEVNRLKHKLEAARRMKDSTEECW